MLHHWSAQKNLPKYSQLQKVVNTICENIEISLSTLKFFENSLENAFYFYLKVN